MTPKEAIKFLETGIGREWMCDPTWIRAIETLIAAYKSHQPAKPKEKPTVKTVLTKFVKHCEAAWSDKEFYRELLVQLEEIEE